MLLAIGNEGKKKRRATHRSKKTQKATASHSEPFKAIVEPLLEKKKSEPLPGIVIGQDLHTFCGASGSSGRRFGNCSGSANLVFFFFFK